MKRDNKGFTLMEMLIVLAIIAILVTMAVPEFTGLLERTRETADLANVRTAYHQIMLDACLGEDPPPIRVPLTQKQSGWQGTKLLRVADIVHNDGDGDTDNWQGRPRGDGMCIVSFSFQKGILFNWNGYPFNTEEKLFETLKDSGLPETLKNNNHFEIDSTCPDSTMVPLMKNMVKNNSLLRTGTWAFLGDGTKADKGQYLYWTCVDTNKVGPGVTIPIIVQTKTGEFYISTSTTATRDPKDTGKKEAYVTIADHLSDEGYAAIIKRGTTYGTLMDAYDAYEELVTKGEYKQYKDDMEKCKEDLLKAKS